MQKRTIQKVIIVLCFLEILVGLTEIGLAFAYLFGAAAPVETPQGAVIAMTAIYVLFVAALFWTLLVMIKANIKGVNVPKKNLTAVLTVTFILAVFMFIQIITGLITRYNESYFILSLSWNIPRLLLDVTTTIFCLLYICRRRIKTICP